MPLGRHIKMQSAATTGNGNEANSNGVGREHVIYITGSAGVGAGAIQFEEAPSPGYAGTWKAIGSPVTVVASTTTTVRLTGCGAVFRARVSTTVTGGTVDVDYFSNSGE